MWHNPEIAVKLDPYKVLKDARVINPQDGSKVSALQGLEEKRALVVLLPQVRPGLGGGGASFECTLGLLQCVAMHRRSPRRQPSRPIRRPVSRSWASSTPPRWLNSSKQSFQIWTPIRSTSA